VGELVGRGTRLETPAVRCPPQHFSPKVWAQPGRDPGPAVPYTPLGRKQAALENRDAGVGVHVKSFHPRAVT
jgi:hypothetical protein